MTLYDLHAVERDIIRLALRGDVDMRRYVPEVMSVCVKLGLPDPPWFEDEAVRDRVAANRANMPIVWTKWSDEESPGSPET